MTDGEARDVVLRRLYDIRHTVPQASPKDFADLQFDVTYLGNILEQLAQKNLIHWNSHRNRNTGTIDILTARINVFGVEVIEKTATAKAAQPPPGESI
jgi:hypothetical protein